MILIDYNDRRPIYEQIIDRFQTLILNGALEADSKLPSVRALAIELSVNPNTIQRAYAELERSGFIYSVKGRGNFVKADESLVKKYQEKMLKELDHQLSNCRESGIKLQEIEDHVTKIYKEVAK